MAGLLGNDDPRDYQAQRGGLLGIDMSRPKLNNADGSFSTEETITIEAGGKFYNIPTIVKGVRVPQDAAVLLWRAGDNPHVGEYRSLQEAVDMAKQRSGLIGTVRGVK
jgi:hypothetical protein